MGPLVNTAPFFHLALEKLEQKKFATLYLVM